MKCKRLAMIAVITGVLAVIGGWAIAAQEKQDKYTLKVPGGLAFSEFSGHEGWAGHFHHTRQITAFLEFKGWCGR